MNKPIYGTQPTRYIIANVHMNDEYYDTSIILLVNLTDSLIETINNAKKLIIDNKDTLSIYNIVVWDNVGTYIDAEAVNDFNSQNNEYFNLDNGFSYISEETYNSLIKTGEEYQTIRTEGTTMEIHETQICFSGNIKYGSNFTSSGISLSLM